MEKYMPVIYKATNRLDDKSYVGYTKDLNIRVNAHRYKAIRGGGQYFQNAITKHGFDNFEWSIIKEDASLDDERAMIELHGTYWKTGKGYNLTMGGEGKLGYVTSDETKEKIAAKKRGHTPSEKQLKALRANAQRMKETGHTDDAKARIGAKHKGKKLSKEHLERLNSDRSFMQSTEYRETMSAALKGKKRTPEQRENYRRAALNRTREHQENINIARRKKRGF